LAKGEETETNCRSLLSDVLPGDKGTHEENSLVARFKVIRGRFPRKGRKVEAVGNRESLLIRKRPDKEEGNR